VFPTREKQQICLRSGTMYTINTDMDKKLVNVEISGTIDYGRIKVFISEIEEIIYHFRKQEASVLILLNRMDPVAQEYLPLLIKSVSGGAEYIRRIAIVQDKVVTRMQMKRIENEVAKIIARELEIRRFDNKRDALKYLLSN
jgi:hypothetical protein